MEGTIAEIRLFAGNFAPRTWAFCAGQILSIAQNTALFSLLGTTYGGNGQTTFALPDFRGRVAVGTGQGPGLPNVVLGEVSGSPTMTLTTNNMPSHNHLATLNASTVRATAQTPTAGAVLGRATDSAGTAIPFIYSPAGSATSVALGSTSVATGLTGGNQPFSIMQPYLGMNYIICLFGIFPSRS
jgi:microcystin-dependent protein